MNIVLYVISTYLVTCIIGCFLVGKRRGNQKVKIMSCRSNLKKFRKLDEAEKNSLF